MRTKVLRAQGEARAEAGQGVAGVGLGLGVAAAQLVAREAVVLKEKEEEEEEGAWQRREGCEERMMYVVAKVRAKMIRVPTFPTFDGGCIVLHPLSQNLSWSVSCAQISTQYERYLALRCCHTPSERPLLVPPNDCRLLRLMILQAHKLPSHAQGCSTWSRHTGAERG